MEYKKPYPGIRAFEENERDIFFGRDNQIEYLMASLNKGFVAVIGSSGSGKSSLVKAGLIPELRKKDDWTIGVMKPQRSPIENLVKMLTSIDWEINKDETFHQAVQFNINLSSAGITETYSQSLSKKKLMLIIDQFEELFSFKDETLDGKTNPRNVETALKFVNLLVHAAKSDESICILITMRSEFLGNCADFKGLPELINEGQFLIPRLTRDQFREAIIKPVGKFAVTISPALVSQMLNDIEYDPDQLPVLQHSLMRMWNALEKAGRTEGAVLTQDTYQAIGGMQNAIDNHANEIYEQLKQKDLSSETKAIFQRLTKIRPGGEGVRNRQSFEELRNITGASDKKLLAILNIFRMEGVNFLLPPSKEEIKETTNIDIAHETLIRKWKILRDDWMVEEEEHRRKLEKLIDRQSEYQTDTKAFLTGSVLTTYTKWHKYQTAKNPSTQAWAKIHTSRFNELIQFIDTSIVLKKAQEDEEIKKKRIQKNAYRLAFGLIVLGLIAAVVILIKIQDYERKDSIAKSKVDSLQIKMYEAEIKHRKSLDSIGDKNMSDRRIYDSIQSIISKTIKAYDQKNNELKTTLGNAGSENEKLKILVQIKQNEIDKRLEELIQKQSIIAFLEEEKSKFDEAKKKFDDEIKSIQNRLSNAQNHLNELERSSTVSKQLVENYFYYLRFDPLYDKSDIDKLFDILSLNKNMPFSAPSTVVNVIQKSEQANEEALSRLGSVGFKLNYITNLKEGSAALPPNSILYFSDADYVKAFLIKEQLFPNTLKIMDGRTLKTNVYLKDITILL
jgi:energy-coupling factor transporter ATP-binding protein EcfA2